MRIVSPSELSSDVSDVVRLVAEGLSDEQIGWRLEESSEYVSKILKDLQASTGKSRLQLAVWFTRYEALGRFI